MNTQAHVVTTPAGGGDITPAPDGSAHLQEASNTAEAAGVVERAKPDESPAAPGSDEIDVEEIFNFDIEEFEPEDDTDGLAFRRSRDRVIFTAGSDGQTTIHRSNLWGEKMPLMFNEEDMRSAKAQILCLENDLRLLHMAMRDHYAISALNGLLAYGYSPRELVVEEAFRIADLALKERSK